jgi:hypothetical protein
MKFPDPRNQTERLAPATITYMETLRSHAKSIRQNAKVFEAKRVGKVTPTPAQISKEFSLAVGDWAFFKRPAEVRDKETKLMTPWIGPWEIIGANHPRYTLRDPNDQSRTRDKHIDDIKQFIPPLEPMSADELSFYRQNLAARDDKGHVVDKIVGHEYDESQRAPGSMIKHGYRLVVRWKGYGESEDLLLPYSEVENLEALVEYLKAFPDFNKVLRRRSDRGTSQQLEDDKKH